MLNQSIIDSIHSNCIEITSNNVVFDGAGYTIDGIDLSNANGIYIFNISSLANVTVQNAKLTDWNNGIYYRATINGNIDNNTANSNVNGIYISQSGFLTLTSNNASSNSAGIYFDHSSDNTLNNNTVNLNGDGIIFVYSSGNTLTNNTLKLNGNGISFIYSSGNILISNNASSNSHGIYFVVSGSNTLTNNTANSNIRGIDFSSSSGYNILTNNTANSNNFGIYFSSSGNNILTNNNANLNQIGIDFDYSSGNILTSNTAKLNSDYGIFSSNSGINTFYNNYFMNINNLGVIGTNILNTTKQQGTNIIGGSYLGGNFWANPFSNGFSQICTNSDGDGICDSPYVLYENNIDYLPLTSIDTILPAIRFINGTVKDNFTGNNLTGVNVSANSTLSTTTNENGFYSFAVTNGTYNLIATFDIRYYTNTTTVSTIGKAVAEQDIELVKKPTGNITGRVTK